MVQISKERFALGSYQYLRYPFEYFLDTAVLLGMQNVELWAAGPSFCLDTMDEAQLKEKAAQFGAVSFQYAVSRRSNASIRSIWQQKMKKYVNIAYAILNVHFMQQKY